MAHLTGDDLTSYTVPGEKDAHQGIEWGYGEVLDLFGFLVDVSDVVTVKVYLPSDPY
jgi:hypothetical protein